MMFSGGSDSTESQNYTQWALNPSAYQNMQNEQVDWAALAHQWIKMKEAGPPIPTDKMVNAPNAPPPPIISNTSSTMNNKSRKQIEGGEAPMDVANDSDSNLSDSNDSLSWPQTPTATASGQQQHQSTNWGWNNTSWPPAIQTITATNKTPLLPTPAYNAYSTTSKEESTFSGNYWTGNGSSTGTQSASGTGKMLKPHNKRFSKVNVPMVKGHSTSTAHQNQTPPPMIDANKRKQLPAWIREGLEKMERDKLKQMDRNREREKLEDLEEKKKLRENAMEILKSSVKQKPINDYDDSNDMDDDDENETEPPPAPQITQPIIQLTHEEMMLRVRRTMTEILLKVTNREISQICKEELQRHVRKQKANDQHVTAPSAGANLSARLGLGVYDGSGESSDESEDDNGKTEQDSDNDLRDTIRRRKEEFSKIEKEIENRLAEAEKDTDGGRSRRESPASDSSIPDKSQDRRSHTPKSTRKSTSSSIHTRKRHSSRSQSSSSTSSSDRRSSRKDRHVHRSRSSSRSTDRRSRRSSRRSRSKKRSPARSRRSSSRSPRPSRRDTQRIRKYSRSGSNYRRQHNDRRRDSRRSDSRSPYRRSRSGSRRRCGRRSRSKTRSRSRSYDSGRGKRSHRH